MLFRLTWFFSVSFLFSLFSVSASVTGFYWAAGEMIAWLHGKLASCGARSHSALDVKPRPTGTYCLYLTWPLVIIDLSPVVFLWRVCRATAQAAPRLPLDWISARGVTLNRRRQARVKKLPKSGHKAAPKHLPNGQRPVLQRCTMIPCCTCLMSTSLHGIEQMPGLLIGWWTRPVKGLWICLWPSISGNNRFVQICFF